MSKIQNLLHRIKPVYQSSTPMANLVISATIVLCGITMVTLRVTQWNNQQTLALLHTQAAAIEQENSELTQRISELGTLDSFRRIAAEELGLVDPDTIVIESD